MNRDAEIEQEQGDRWVAQVAQLPGVAVYGGTAEEAVRKAGLLALRALGGCLESPGGCPGPVTITITVAAAV